MDRLDKSFLRKGVFWLPESDGHKLSGELRFDQNNGINLALHGVLLHTESPRLIYGILEGKACTLFKSYQKSTLAHYGSGGTQQLSEYSANYVFLGAHFDPETETHPVMLVSFNHFDEWLHHIAFKYLPQTDNYKKIACFDPYPSPTARLDAINANLSIGHNVQMSGSSFSSMTWTGTVMFKVEPDSSQPFFFYFEDCVTHLQQLLTLLIGRPMFPTLIQIGKRNDYKDVLFAQPDADRQSNFSFVQMVIKYPEIQHLWPSVVANWFDNLQKFESARTLLFGAIYFNHNVELYFLTLIQALESYSRSAGSAHYMAEEDYRTQVYATVVKAIPSGIDDSLRESLKNKLKYGNEFSLRKRLKLLFEQIPPDLLNLVRFSDPNIISVLVNNRNYLTHYTDELKLHYVKPLALWVLAKGMETILLYLFFQAAGVPDNKFMAQFKQERRVFFS